MNSKLKAQSMIEYLVILTAIVIVLAIISGNAGLLRGGIQRVYDDTEEDFEQDIQTTMDGTHQETVSEYTAASYGVTMRDASEYEGQEYFEDKQLAGYYYHEGESDMSGVPSEGTTTATDIVYEDEQVALWPENTAPTASQSGWWDHIDWQWWAQHFPDGPHYRP
jgi:hypothetical protein